MSVQAQDADAAVGSSEQHANVAMRAENWAQKCAKTILLGIVNFYIAALSPFFGGACKFYPSCSQYAREAIARHGAKTGGWLALKRLGRCRPFTQGGYDPVPDKEEIATLQSMARHKELMKWTR
ncbi:MAG TPA: membrane protein insertion efficiency factor YidD [Candidatus Acidoferrum sp.]|nr:membrane protein insertion efficiency factor YidD [Candidatus Acidoferrum sp.]